ncbi:MAG: transcription termination/antitermination NusG family protein [Opitutaceae bacterium]|nr:transcription termination/antitermination NusG family protein [Opitutaceae bacterium]
MGQSLPNFTEPRWFACHTKPRCEKKFASLLAIEKFTHYLPLVQSVRRYAQQTKRFTKPLFPGYVFVRIEPEVKNRIYQQDLLVRSILVENEPIFLRQLEEVKAIVASGLEASLHPLLKKGTRVKVIGGPLHGLEGFVDNPANPKGIVLSVDVLQQGLLVRLPLDLLKVLP